MRFPAVTAEQWRAQVDKELEGQPFDKALVGRTADGLPLEPLYVSAPVVAARPALFQSAAPFRICIQLPRGTATAQMQAELSDGADALWVAQEDFIAGYKDTPSPFWMVEVPSSGDVTLPLGAWKGCLCVRGQPGALAVESGRVVSLVQKVKQSSSSVIPVLVSAVPFHDSGATEAEEVAYVLASGVRCLEALIQAGHSPVEAARWIALQTVMSQSTLVEVAKIRALRVCWHKVLKAVGALESEPHRTLIHAVCSHRTLTVRDPWVNLLRVTTQMFAGVLGGADWVTPLPFDEAFGVVSERGRRMARNTGLILREESRLADVADPVGGAYFFESMTDAIARQAWRVFQDIEAQGGLPALLNKGELQSALHKRYADRQVAVSRRQAPIVGVSEFANLDEVLPHPVPSWPFLNDAQAFEALRGWADTLPTRPEALLVTLGPPSESRARAAFAAGFLAAGGIRTRESAEVQKAAVACLCGKDERYAEEGPARVAALKKAGCATVLVAGKPGAQESALRAAGVDGFIHLGADAVQTLSWLLYRL